MQMKNMGEERQMEDNLYVKLKEILDKLNKLEEDYFLTKGKLVELESKLSFKKAQLIKAKKITGRNDMFREAQLIQWAETEYQEVRKAQKDFCEILSRYYPLKREWELFSLIVNSKR